MAMYRIKERRVESPQFDEAEYWMEMRPSQRAAAQREGFDRLNQLTEDEDPDGPIPDTNPWRRSKLIWILAGVAVLSFVMWSFRDYIFSDKWDFSLIARSNQLSQDQAVADLKQAVVSIECSGSSGTGFNISPEGLIVTNAHVVAGGGYVTLYFPQGDKRVFIGGEITFLDGVDLALIDIDGEDLPCLELADEPSGQGDTVIFIGNPLGYDWTVSEGVVVGQAYVDELSVICLNGPIRPGSSGSPVFNDHSQVIGVVFAMLTQAEDLGLAIPVSYLTEFIDSRQSASP